MEINSHEIDFMCQVCGDATRVYAEGDHFGCEDPSDYPNLAFISLRFAGGAVGMLHTSTVSEAHDISGKIQGSTGTLTYTDGFGSAGELVVAPRGGEPRRTLIRDIDVEQPVRKEVRLFLEAIAGSGSPSVTPAEGRRNVRIAEAAYESASTGRPVSI